MPSKDAQYFNVSEKHEMNQVCRKYEDPEAVKNFIRQKASEGVIKYWTHEKLAEYLAENGFRRVPKAPSLSLDGLAKWIQERSGLDRHDAGTVLGAFVGTLKDALSTGEKVEVRGFGTFKVVERKARKGRNPQTGEEIDIPSRKTVSFVPGKLLKDAVNAGQSDGI